MPTTKLILLSLAVLSMQAHAADAVNKTSCPAFLNSKTNVLVEVHLFDGEVSENAELVPDNENSASNSIWDISGYKDSGRSMHLVCDYKDHARKDLTVAMPAGHCYARGHKTVTAWCGK